MEYKHIENKKTDAVSVKIKNDAWGEITSKYNTNCQTGQRNCKQLHALNATLKYSD